MCDTVLRHPVWCRRCRTCRTAHGSRSRNQEDRSENAGSHSLRADRNAFLRNTRHRPPNEPNRPRRLSGCLSSTVETGSPGLERQGLVRKAATVGRTMRYPTGADLREARKRAGLSQSELARRAGLCRNTVQYWENKPRLAWRGWAIGRMIDVLGIDVLPDSFQSSLHIYLGSNARAWGWGLSPGTRQLMEAERLAAEARRREIDQQIADWASRRRVTCGAMTRKGTPCRMKSEPGKRRCKYHGGRSTGPKTAEGRARIAEAQRRRWATWRAEQKGR